MGRHRHLGTGRNHPPRLPRCRPFAGIVAYDLLKIETTRDQQAAQESALAAADRKRDHASHLSFWLTVRNIRAEHDEVYEPDAPHIEIVLHIVNTSDRPAMSLTATAGLRGDVWRDAAATDGTELDEHTIQWTAPAIAPGGTLEIPCGLQVPASVARIVDNYRDALIGELLFTDAAGTTGPEATLTGGSSNASQPTAANNMHLSLTQRDQQRRDRSRD